MPRRPKKARELTSEEALRKLFPAKVRREAEEKAREALGKGKNKD